jgi:methylmalonyl-CoA mutase, C-terminal domain
MKPILAEDRSTDRKGGRTIRVLIAKPGLDGHDRGAKVMTRALRDAGMEVIYTGLFQTPEMIARAALDEDVDVVGLSILSGAHNTLVPEVIHALERSGLSDVLLVVGGTIPRIDIEPLYELGVSAIFGPGTPLDTAIQYIQKHAPQREDHL